jgi:hypothetical protein
MWPFTRKTKLNPPILLFKTGEAFFEMQCEFGCTELRKDQSIVAIVLDAKKKFGMPAAVEIKPNGNQLVTIRVASQDGGFFTVAETNSNGGDRLKPGDLVVWVPVAYHQEIAKTLGDERSGWVGPLIAKIAPEANPNDNELKVICRY